MKSATLVALVCVLRCEWSGSFLVSSTRGPCSFKRKRGQPQQHQQQQQHVSSRRTGPSLMQASRGEIDWEGKLFELDVVEYRVAGQDQGPGEEDRLELASYIGDGKLQPLVTREESGPRVFFHDEDAPPVSLSSGSCHIVRVLDEVSYGQRNVEDRVKNPHGEEAEDCFLIEGTLNPAVVIRVEE